MTKKQPVTLTQALQRLQEELKKTSAEMTITDQSVRLYCSGINRAFKVETANELPALLDALAVLQDYKD